MTRLRRWPRTCRCTTASRRPPRCAPLASPRPARRCHGRAGLASTFGDVDTSTRTNTELTDLIDSRNPPTTPTNPQAEKARARKAEEKKELMGKLEGTNTAVTRGQLKKNGLYERIAL